MIKTGEKWVKRDMMKMPVPQKGGATRIVCLKCRWAGGVLTALFNWDGNSFTPLCPSCKDCSLAKMTEAEYVERERKRLFTRNGKIPDVRLSKQSFVTEVPG